MTNKLLETVAMVMGKFCPERQCRSSVHVLWAEIHMNQPTLWMVAATMLVGVVFPARGQTPTFANVPYGTDHARQVLDVWVPPSPTGPKPVVVWVHGGGWQGGDKSTATGSGKAAELLSRGFVVAAINYRYSTQAIFPAQIHDCKGAIRYLRAHAAQFQIDPTRVGVWGSSAGGHLVALLGTSGGVLNAEGSVGGNLGFSSRVNAVADFFGPSDFLNVDGWHSACTPDSAEEKLLGVCLGELQANVLNPASPWPEKVALALLAGAVTHVTSDDPPFYIAHGTADTTVYPEHSELLYSTLATAGVPATLRRVEGAAHGLPSGENAAVYAFFLAQLTTIAACRSDFNADGFLDFTDFDAFISAFEVGLASADFNGDGFLDFTDFDEFVRAFEAGCD